MRLRIGAGLAIAIWLALVGAAHAATANASVTIASGGLNITTQSGSVNFGTVTLDGTDQTVVATAAPTFRVVDATGSNAGWNVTFSASNFTDGSNSIANTNFSFSATGGSVTAVSGQAINATNGPKETALGLQNMASARKVLTTAATYGKGRYDYTPAAGNFQLVVPATTLVGSYTSTLTATVASGP